jgi:hypothetical protein
VGARDETIASSPPRTQDNRTQRKTNIDIYDTSSSTQIMHALLTSRIDESEWLGSR